MNLISSDFSILICPVSMCQYEELIYSVAQILHCNATRRDNHKKVTPLKHNLTAASTAPPLPAPI